MMQNEGGTMGGGGVANVCQCLHHKTIPIIIIVFGVLFLLGALEVVSARIVSIAWPLLVIVGGCQKMMGGKCKCC
ncbi:MAG: DUF5668 domain-containing protein [Candidatus Sungbacteria bacterium]|nr:DUF5668 domain-containing protein [Candidatus Sungbacteria bacterium]